MIFKKIKIRNKTFSNRVSVSPMCQYSAINGKPNKWHYRHLSNLVESGAGSLTVESTAISKKGRITEKDLCIYNQNQMKSHKKLLRYLKSIRDIPIILQLSHSGRKGSAEIPWIKKNTPLKKPYSWKTYAPSKVKRDYKWPLPKEMTNKVIKKTIKDFKNSARLAFKAGYDGVEIHMAHGYLLHQFFSPLSNKRIDEYGLKDKLKYRIHIEIIKSIKKISKEKILGARVTGTDHLSNGTNLKDCINLVKKLKSNGLDYICVSSGGIVPKTNMKIREGFRVSIASKIKKECKILTRTSGMINDYKFIDKILKQKKIDFVAIGRKFISDKFFLFKDRKKRKNDFPKQYTYCI